MNTLTKIEKPREVAQKEPSYCSPTVDIVETKDEYLLEADMPGVSKAGLELMLEGNELTIVGRREPAVISDEVLYQESEPRSFRRAFVLAPEIDVARISASIEQGVLCVRLPKAEQVKPRRIKVTD